MNDLVILVVAALAATRWATLLTEDDFGPIRDLREWVEMRFPHAETLFYESVVEDPSANLTRTRTGVAVARVEGVAPATWVAVDPHPLGLLATCIRCMSVWTGLAASVLVVLTMVGWVPVTVALVVFLPFAMSQVAITLKGAD